MNKQLDHLLYSHSQYDDDDELQLNEQLDLVHDKFSDKFPKQSIDEDDAMELGNGQSIQYDHQWMNQQEVQHYFREVAGTSEQFSRSLSINRHDLLQSRGMHDNSINLDNINIHNILHGRKKQEQKINSDDVDDENQQLLKEREKNKCIVKGLNIKIRDLQSKIDKLENTNSQLQERNSQYLLALQKRDQLFNQLKNSYKQATQVISQKQEEIKKIFEKCKQYEKQNQRLNNIINAYTQEQKNLTDFRVSTLKKHSERSISPLKDHTDKQLEKLKRQNSALQIQNNFLQENISGQKEKIKNIEQEYKRKISLKEKKIKELNQNLQQQRQQTSKSKKSTQNSLQFLKQKLQKSERDLNDRDEKIRLLESRSKNNLEEVRKKEDKIKELLLQIEQKNKKINEIKDQLQQEQAKNQIQSKLQKQRESQIDRLEKQVQQLKKLKYELSLKLQTLQKPTNIELKLRKQLQHLKSSNQKLQKDNKELSEDIDNYEKQAIQKDQKIKQLKRKVEEKKSQQTNIRKKTSLEERQTNQYRQIITKLTKQNNQLRRNAELNQEKLNKLFIMESRIQQQSEEEENFISENDFTHEEHLAALQDQLDFKDDQIKSLKESHQMEISRLGEEIQTLEKIIQERQENMIYKQKTIQYLHQKFVALEKQNTELRVSRNILHSSFYDESYEGDGYESPSSRKFLQNKVNTLESALRQKQSTIAKLLSQQDKQGPALKFQNNKLRSRIKQLTQIALSNQNRKIAPQSLNQNQTIQFLQKTLKRILKSSDILKILCKMGEFKALIYNLYRILDKNSNGYNNNSGSHTSIGNSNYRR